MESFQFKCPTKILYGEDKSLSIHEILKEMGRNRVLLLTGKHFKNSDYYKKIKQNIELAKIECLACSDTEPEPSVSLVDLLAQTVRRMDIDCIVAVGGGSVLDTAKAVSILRNNEGSAKDYMFGGKGTIINRGVPLICMPTTAGSGSEVTASSVLSDLENKTKASITHEYLLPELAIIDPNLQMDMPMSVAASTGIDALTHAIEAFVSKHASPMSDLYAKEAISLIGSSIRKAVFFPENKESKGKMALASTLAAVAFMNGGLGAVHGISQAMGGVAHVSHGVGNALMLSYVMEVNVKGNEEKFAQIAKLLGANTEGLSTTEAAKKSVAMVKELVSDLGIPGSLKEVGVEKSMFSEIVKGTMEYRLLSQNPVPINETIVNAILQNAY